MKKMNTVFSIIIMMFVVFSNLYGNAQTEKRDYKFPWEYRYSVADKYLGLLSDSHFFYHLFEDLELFADKKLLAIEPGIKIFETTE